MRSSVVSLLAAGVLALGAVPTALALGDDHRAGEPATGENGGPPPWAPAHGHHKTKTKHADTAARDQAEKRRQQAAWSDDDQGPPPWAKAYGKRGKAAKQARAAAMKAWSACVAAAEAEGTEAEQRAARRSCEKPVPPGHAR